ncbi:hypothetical protein [Serratia sp. JSRIV004]|uniref:hypothetical protein n=1 Tax=Serratia sp. JSRIV004 TaxID=2831895 RepID=UPI001CBC6A40|nr:hypothetical protein [Serratia sp. JSRIV004]UAN55675.1 hypothetical protein KGP21_18545 [Serratia sp. JSRIV004]
MNRPSRFLGVLRKRSTTQASLSLILKEKYYIYNYFLSFSQNVLELTARLDGVSRAQGTVSRDPAEYIDI